MIPGAGAPGTAGFGFRAKGGAMAEQDEVRAWLGRLEEARESGTADGPWRVMDDYPGPHTREILDDEGSVAVCSGDNDGTGNTLGAERAALIVTAVNDLPTLTAALSAVLDLADKHAACCGTVRVDDLRAVVAEAVEGR